MTFSSSIGVVAAFLTTIAFVPQVLLVMRTRNTVAISLWMYLLFSTGVALWLVYGVMLRLWPVIIANSVTLLLSFIVIYYKLRCSEQPLPQQPESPLHGEVVV
jgi:MtN3 and saliva related transmembrane protein